MLKSSFLKADYVQYSNIFLFSQQNIQEKKEACSAQLINILQIIFPTC